MLGVGGSAAHASHAACDFRKLCGLEAYAPTDNVAELTARINDDGWEDALAAWLEGSRLGARDAVLVFSVGGGERGARRVGEPRPRARHAHARPARRCSASSAATAATPARVADESVLVPAVSDERVTPHTEGMCAVVWHLLVSHPALQAHDAEVGVAPLTASFGVGAAAGSSSAARASSAATSSTACSSDPDVEASHGLRQLLVGPRGAPRAERSTTRASRSFAATSRTWTTLVDAARGPRRRRPPRVEPGHRARGDRAEHRLRRGDAAHPPRARGDAASRRSAGSSTPRAAASTATSARSRPTRTGGRSSRSRPTARASSPARR